MKKLAPLIILVLLGGVAFVVMKNPPEADRIRPVQEAQMTVDVLTLDRRPYHVKLDSYGTVQPRTRSMLVAQVDGEITEISDSLREGGFFEKDDPLLNIDSRDYEADVKIAEASLMDARQALAQEPFTVRKNTRADTGLVISGPSSSSVDSKAPPSG